MKPFVPIFALALLGPASVAAEEPGTEMSSVAPMAEPPEQLTPSQGAAEASGRVINPDNKCSDRVIVAEGRDDEAQFRREPAGPTPPPLYYAVDYAVDGCDVLMTTTGELRQLPELPDKAQLLPAQ